MSIDSIFHITTASELSSATTGEYRPSAFDRDGFVHCSYSFQVVNVANRFFHGRSDLVLLEIDPEKFSCPLVAENLEGGLELFPHVYGAIPTSAIVGVHPFPCDPDGRFGDRAIPPSGR